ncbi:unnamed protein product [Trichobilharzia regenti]|nr:unnamed protein product [Trichobilharzia regenti]
MQKVLRIQLLLMITKHQVNSLFTVTVLIIIAIMLIYSFSVLEISCKRLFLNFILTTSSIIHINIDFQVI